MRFGDFLMSGYPGALLTVSKQGSNPKVAYLANVGITDSQLEVANPRCLQLQLQPDIPGFGQLGEYTAINGAFLDFGENG